MLIGMGWEVGSVGEVLAVQTLGPEFVFPEYVCTCPPSPSHKKTHQVMDMTVTGSSSHQ